MTVPVSELQKIAPSAVIELYQLHLNTAQHGQNLIFYFHSGVNGKPENGEVTWAGNNYQRFPIEAEGFEYTGGNSQLPRPKIRVANIFGTVTSLLLTLPALPSSRSDAYHSLRSSVYLSLSRPLLSPHARSLQCRSESALWHLKCLYQITELLQEQSSRQAE